MNNLGKLNLDFKGHRYCELLTNMIKKVDLFDIINKRQIQYLCGELSFVNKSLNKVYNIIFKKGLSTKQALGEIKQLKDKDNKPFINSNDANTIYDKFQELNNKVKLKGGMYDQGMGMGQGMYDQGMGMGQGMYDQGMGMGQGMYNQGMGMNPGMGMGMGMNPGMGMGMGMDPNMGMGMGMGMDPSMMGMNPGMMGMNPGMMGMNPGMMGMNPGMSTNKDTDKDIKTDLEIKTNKKKKKSNNKDDKDDNDDDKEDTKKNIGNIHSRLTYSERKTVNDKFDMMEVLLICLSLLPLAGWAFDFPLLLYSLSQKKYTLAMITVLNWYIWSFLIIFGVNVNLGPTLKASYLGNQENVIKKLLLFPKKEPSKVLNPFVNARPTKIEGDNYLVDDNGNVYSSQVKNPSTVGLLTENGVFIARDSPEYEQSLKAKKDSLKKDKIGPNNIL